MRKGRHAKKARYRWRPLRTLGVALGAAAALALGAGAYLYQALGSFRHGQKAVHVDLREPTNILFLGVDDNGDRLASLHGPNPTTTDVMMVVHLNPATHSVDILSVPRDLHVSVPGYQGTYKIDEANVLGGPALAMRTVSDTLGVPIRGYVLMNYEGVARIVDELGGVTVDVPVAMNYVDHHQGLYIHLPAGIQHLNGLQATEFLRYREYPLGDIERIRMQQRFLHALARQALRPATLTRLPTLLHTAEQNVDTDLGPQDLLHLATWLLTMPPGHLHTATVPGHFEPGSTDWFMDPRRTQDTIATLFAR